MKSTYKNKQAEQKHNKGGVTYRPLFPRPICLEKCTMDIKRGYESDIIKTLRAFSNEDTFKQKDSHKLTDYKIWGYEAWSIDVKSRNDNNRMLFYIDENNICKITNLCTTETH